MNRRKKIEELKHSFSDEKKFVDTGYYRIRTLDEQSIEMAYLVAGSCGETIVHPQITILFDEHKTIGITLIDMLASPPKFLHRDLTNEQEIDLELDALIEKFSHAAIIIKKQN
ncbi:hypothetical protein [Candidatus Enterococcus mansonii]|uniref:Uncharacterized protein n=1 Tax=Candidatus Enterococcus mansonii TaxID=1834181 RepID=A0A242CGK6_9ENTE|nr:hypothetical protein [Enterococcus sp. 4G2_DIV0659]OTO09346.1 hypothetical protein A5880_000025 [Enterococcus sp. 4G2_DIV0659]